MVLKASELHELVISPLEIQFGREIDSQRAKIYFNVLRFYDYEAIKKGMAEFQATWDKASFPQPAVIGNLCKKYVAVVERELSDAPWRARSKSIDDLVSDSVSKFKGSVLFHQVSAESRDLAWKVERLAAAIFDVQAQAIYPLPNDGYGISSEISSMFSYDDDEGYRYYHRNLYMEAKKNGYVDINIPSSFLDKLRGANQ